MRIADLIDNAAPEAVDRWWGEALAAGTPLMEPWGDGRTLVTFLWRGRAESVRAWWNMDVPLTRIPGTDVWHGSEVFPSDLHTAYCLIVDGEERSLRDPGGLDPGNPAFVHFPADPGDPSDQSSWVNVLRLPDAPAEPWTAPRSGVPSGQLIPATVGDDLRVTTYLPAGVETEDLPVLVAFDGYLSQVVMHMPAVLDNLIAERRIPPTAALFVHAVEERRFDDLTPGPAIEQLVAGCLLPWARRTWGIGSPSGDNTVAGMSLGGMVAAHLGLRRPDLFRAVIAHSGSFGWPSPEKGLGEPGRLIRDAARLADPASRFFLDVGVLETMDGPGGAPCQLAVCRGMRDALRGRGCDVTYVEYSGGHDYVNWRRNFAEAMITTQPRRLQAV